MSNEQTQTENINDANDAETEDAIRNVTGEGKDDISSVDAGEDDVSLEKGVLIETHDTKRKAPDGGWGWMIVLGCLLLRTVVGGFGRSSGIFFLKFTEKFGENAASTAWVTSLSATVRLLVGPAVSLLCNRFSSRKLTAVGSGIFVIAVHISAYATSLIYLYFSYGVLGGLGRSFILTPLTILLGEYFDKRRSLAFGLASAGFGLGGFAITPAIEVMFQEYGFTGTYILLSGIACHLFVCVSLFRPVSKKSNHVQKTRQNASKEDKYYKKSNITNGSAKKEEYYISSTGSVNMYLEEDTDSKVATQKEMANGSPDDQFKQTEDENKTKSVRKNKIISFSIFKDIRFMTLFIATFIFTLPSSGLFLPALAKSRGLSDIQAAYLLSIISGSDTVSRIIAGFVLDMKSIRDLRPYVFNLVAFVRCLSLFTFPSLQNFQQFTAVCVLHGASMGVFAAQRSVILIDILGVDKLSSSFAFLLLAQGTGTLVGPPVNGVLKDTYGKYDYAFYFGGSSLLLGSIILACGNIRNYINKRKHI